MANEKRFRVTDESINSFGFRILTSGIDMENFKKNPVGYYNHETEGGPIIKWSDIQLQGDTITAIPIFDQEDKTGKKVAKKVEGDFIRTCSMAVNPLEFSDDPKYMLPGQTKPTVVRCELVEISVTDIGSNKNAVALMDNGVRIDLKDENAFIKLRDGIANPHQHKAVELRKEEILKTKNTMKNLILLSAALGITLAADATEDQATQLVLNSINTLKGEKETLKLKADEAAVKLADEHKAKCLILVDGAVSSKKIALADKINWLKTAEANYETTKLMLDGLKPTVKLSDIPGSKGPVDLNLAAVSKDRSNWTFSDWKKNDSKGLIQLKAENLEEYTRLFNEDPKNTGVVIS